MAGIMSTALHEGHKTRIVPSINFWPFYVHRLDAAASKRGSRTSARDYKAVLCHQRLHGHGALSPSRALERSFVGSDVNLDDDALRLEARPEERLVRPTMCTRTRATLFVEGVRVGGRGAIDRMSFSGSAEVCRCTCRLAEFVLDAEPDSLVVPCGARKSWVDRTRRRYVVGLIAPLRDGRRQCVPSRQRARRRCPPARPHGPPPGRLRAAT